MAVNKRCLSNQSTAAVYRKTERYRPSTICLNTELNVAKQTMRAGNLISSEVYSGMSCGHEASVNGDVVSNALCSRGTDTSDRLSKNTVMFMQSVFNNGK